MPQELLGPTGLLIGLAFAVGALWRDHLRADADDRAQRDRAMDQADALRLAVEKLTAAVEQDAKDRADRHRRADQQ